MLPSLQFFSDMPAPLKAGLLLAGGATPLGVLLYLNPRIAIVVFAGLAVVGVLMALFWKILKFFKKRKSLPFEQGLKQNTSSIPQGVSAQQKIANLDDLRRKFEEGLDTFKAAGKTLYDFPWYMIVGEPGSGKTEAIRHCNIGFPPGLQDEYQGAGGTLNMNWWFTDHAVILDTAGRLMFEEVEPGQSSEWKEFLKLLRKSRRNCPVNGVFLAIPADSLIKDTADEIEKKANKIARQFDLIQRTLDVRFPVFVLITKSDLITGFRDFFENMQDPQLQHQIFGWSNPGSLDEPYSSGFIEQQMKTIQGRLYRRRLALMQQMAIDGGDYAEMRQVDALYSFPHSLKKLAPRMARYLELIFSVGNQWSCKPLFFRGIYFTSAMQEGSVLDEELAETLGVSVDSLPDGRVWKRDRAYFLRDLFIRKVFQEKGLVTRATNANRQHRQRRAVMLSAAIASMLVLIAFTWVAYRQFRGSVGDLEAYINELRKPASLENLTVITGRRTGEYEYKGHMTSPFAGEAKSEIHFHLAQAIQKSDPQRYPLVRAFLSRAIDRDRLETAQRIVYQDTVLIPFIRAVAGELPTWREGDAYQQALRQLLLIRTGQVEKLVVAAESPPSREETGDMPRLLDPLVEYLCALHPDSVQAEDQNNWKQYLENREVLHYPLDEEGVKAFVERMGYDEANPFWAEVDTAIQAGVDNFLRRLRDGVPSDDQGLHQALDRLMDLFHQYESVENQLLVSSEWSHWQSSWGTLNGLKETIQGTLQQNEILASCDRLGDLYVQVIRRQEAQIGRIDFLLEAFPNHSTVERSSSSRASRAGLPDPAAVSEELEPAKALHDSSSKKTASECLDYAALYDQLAAQKAALLQELKARQTEVAAQLQKIDAAFWEKIQESRKYEVRYGAYKAVHDFATEALSNGTRIPPDYRQVVEHINERDAAARPDYQPACVNCILEAVIKVIPDNTERLTAWISNHAENQRKTGREFNDLIVSRLADHFARIENDVASNPHLLPRFEARKQAWVDYLKAYGRYWSETYIIEETSRRVKLSALGIDRWGDLKKILSDPGVRKRVEQAYTGIQEEAANALVIVNAAGGQRAGDVMPVVDRWAELASSGKLSHEIGAQIADEIQQKAAVWLGQYCVYAGGSENPLEALFRAAFAAEALRLLAEDIGVNVQTARQEIDRLSQFFPFSRSAPDDASLDQLKALRNAVGNLLPRQNDETVEVVIFDGSGVLPDAMQEAFRMQQVQINKILAQLRGVDLPEPEALRYGHIQKILDCLPADGRPGRCKISVVPSDPRYYDDKDNYRGSNFKWRSFRINDSNVGESSPGNPSAHEAAFPGDALNIQVCEYTDYGGMKTDFSSSGRWAIFRMILDDNHRYRFEHAGQDTLVYLDYDLGEGDHLYLQVLFAGKELPDPMDWPK